MRMNDHSTAKGVRPGTGSRSIERLQRLGRLERLGRFATAVGLAIVLCGVPLVLTSLHLAPPIGHVVTEIGHPGTWNHLLQSHLSDDALVKIVVLVAWVAWCWLALCVLLEIIASLRGVPTIRLPGSRHAQSLAALLVGACLALLPAPRTASHLRIQTVATAQLHPVTMSEVVLFEDRVSTWPGSANERDPVSHVSTLSGNGEGGAEVASSEARTYVVRPGDTLWSIAEEQLGSPLRWREVAALNLGRPQSDGREFTDAHWIFPGWVLALPASPPSSPVESSSVAPGPAPSAFAPFVPSESDGPRQDVRLPSLVDDAPAPPGPSSVNGSRSFAIDSGNPASGHHGDHGHHDPVPIAPIGFGILGASVIALLDRMRRAQQRHRRRGLRITLPEGELSDFEMGLRLGADSDAADWIDIGQRLLSASLTGRDNRGNDLKVPRLVGARLLPEVVEFLLDGPSSQPPPPFEESPDRSSWLLPRESGLLERLRNDPTLKGSDVPVPGLVTLGRDEHGLILLDLERVGSLEIRGSQSEQLAQAIAVEMACSRWSDQVDIVVVGMFPEIEQLERVIHATSIASVVQRMGRRVLERKKLLEIVRHATNYETRWLEGGDAWDLCLVLCMEGAARAEGDALSELVELAGDGALGLSIVFCSDDYLGARTRVVADGGPLLFEGFGNQLTSLRDSPVWPQAVPETFVENVTTLVGVASDLEGTFAPASEEHDAPSISITEEFEVQEGVVVVRVLGPVDVIGAARPFTRAWALELVVYLAMHRKSVSTTEKWATALWPDRLMAPASLHSTASAARRALGTTSSGVDHLPRSHGSLSLGPGVTTDWDSFVALSRSDDPQAWRRAIELIRGRPFEGLRAADWAILEGISAMIEAEVVDLASRYSEWCLSSRNAADAEWSVRHGLMVSPYDERLYRLLMRAADVAGNPAGVEAVMKELVHLVAEDIEPFDAVHPETFELYRSLSRRTSARGI